MAINIKNERVIELAQQASRLTGNTQTGVIEQALRELISREQRASPTTRMNLVWQTLEIVDARLGQAERDAMQRAMDEMYDEEGLPA
ncbi:type II toxin-antitoxin system VapB family antitoxin [Luteococcus sp. H138]|uniref:type II toxin-antitoxin system VapB family antitoxin n=1 Tax=unclassified Luteococcus TaxID=2639923 RepID=UPI00313C99C9